MIYNVNVKQASWLTRKILGAAKYLNEANIGVGEVMNARSYSIRDMYNKLRGEFPKVEWRRLLCNNTSSPKWIFIFYLAIMDRLSTRDMLITWGILANPSCSLCEGGTEDHDHLFFRCTYSAAVRRKLLYWIGVKRDVAGWNEEVKWAIKLAAGKQPSATIYRILLTCTVYHIWQERNWRTFRRQQRRSEELVKTIIQEVHCRGSLSPSLAKRFQDLNFYP
ncbi:uncharacterized protein LOC142166137 [Nicotiana tabacum]|uniref:Uncharacterized protein LOC142166137 n=1 Tax=Nicotiana tabacum TaxID=4097 RepID=A0AC58S6T7_TOBAC